MSDTSKRPIIYSSRHAAEVEDQPIADIDRDPLFTELFAIAREYTMTSKEVMFSLYQAARYVAVRQIPGDFVECGVWRGGSSLLAALTFRHLDKPAKRHLLKKPRPRQLWLYDTFEGMTAPTAADVDIGGNSASGYIEQFADDGRWCYADAADVRNTFDTNGFDDSQVRLVKGDVLETLRKPVPEAISILRLDTDWYESTKLELEVLYPRLVTGGVLIIDDYGHWEGSRQAVDELFAKTPSLLLHRTSYAVRTAIKL
ncbi:TylF/MycF/NovP-related O-methyltransferase [Aminobacter sp. LjRoot7]|uniref:TylF/MycF/NovP-related O-methyltransferase n=1 Tax=Aminobacter sp. LjRoot7 TaxID=3342335 RepID=UPI003ECD7301